MNIKSRLILILMALFGLTAMNAQSYESREGDSINPRFYLNSGFFFPNIDTGLRIDSSLGIGTEINLEDDLKLDENIEVFKFGALVRVSPRSQLLAGFTAIDRSQSLSLEEDIEVGDTIFYAGSNAKIKFDVNYFALTWRYSFFNEKNWNAGLSFGARVMDINTSFNALLNDDSYFVEEGIIAPAVLFGVHGSAYLTPRLLARYSLEYLYLDIKGIDITVLESAATVSYFIFKNVGLGLGYSTNNYRLKNIPLSDDFDGKVIFGFGGFNLFLTARF